MPQPKVHESHAQRQAAYRRRCQEARSRQLQEKGLPDLPAISDIPGTARWRQAAESAARLLALVEDEMQAYYNDRSEAWLSRPRGARATGTKRRPMPVDLAPWQRDTNQGRWTSG